MAGLSKTEGEKVAALPTHALPHAWNLSLPVGRTIPGNGGISFRSDAAGKERGEGDGEERDDEGFCGDVHGK